MARRIELLLFFFLEAVSMYTVIYRAELDGAKDKLRDVSGRMKDLRKPLKQAGEYMQLEVEDRGLLRVSGVIGIGFERSATMAGLSPRERSHPAREVLQYLKHGSISA